MRPYNRVYSQTDFKSCRLILRFKHLVTDLHVRCCERNSIDSIDVTELANELLDLQPAYELAQVMISICEGQTPTKRLFTLFV